MDSSFLYNFCSFHHKQSKVPLIGVSMDFVDPRIDTGGGWYSAYPWYALGTRYCEAIVHFGGVPVMLSYNLSNLEIYAQILDGLLLVGIGADVDPVFYGKDPHKATHAKSVKTQFEWGLTKKMMDLNKPILGINTGMHLINVIHGGTLFQHLAEEKPKAAPHQQYTPLTSTFHPVKVYKKTRLFDIFMNCEKEHIRAFPEASRSIVLETNSYHRQSVKKLGKGLLINVKTFDNVIEGIESLTLKFCFGVQWNPEFLVTPLDEALFKAFLQMASLGNDECEGVYSLKFGQQKGMAKALRNIRKDSKKMAHG